MMRHEGERLSAWLDDELPPAERAEVEAHLAACEECAALLADLEAVDDLARELPAEAPARYFETFPERVRARVESTTRARSRAGGRLPVWTWAAAAVLLLAIVTPLTLDRLDHGGGTPTRQDPVAQPRQESAKLATRSNDREEPDDVAGADRHRAPETEGKRETGRARRLEERAGEPEPAFAAPPAPAPIGAAASRPQTPAPASETLPPPAAVPGRESRPAERWADAPSPDTASAPAEGEAREEALAAAPEARPQRAKDDRRAPGVVGEPAPVTAPVKGQGATPQALERSGGLTSVEKKTVPEDALPYARLARATPAGAAAWREHREAWRAFVSAHPQSRHADEARVRVIESGLEAWRAGADPEDLARARADGEAYLGRDDAKQRQRVRRALEDASESPR